MTNTLELLQRAIESGEPITIVYNGGSTPGRRRQVIALSTTADELVAREPGARQAKHFKLAKIASASLDGEAEVANPDAAPAEELLAPRLATIAEYVAHFKPKYAAEGWNIFEGSQSFGVGTFFKNGSPRKTPLVNIQFVDRTEVHEFDFETGEVTVGKKELTGRERPWRVDSNRLPQGKAFGDLQKAMECFAKEVAESTRPTKGNYA